ncbi:MAG: CPBP family intramembrane metalloprotease [Fimbriimonadaceae bacterium]|nr:CPBP family intramembrane metalloprotease [Chitinophagales bacterium]
MKGIIAQYPVFAKLFIFIGVILLVGIAFQYVALLITNVIFPGADLLNLFNSFDTIKSADELSGTQKNAMKCYQLFASLGQYILAPLFFVHLCGDNFFSATGMKKSVPVVLFILVFFIFFSSIGVIGYINELNQNIKLPSFLSDVESAMRKMEEQAKIQTDAFLSATSVSGLIANILIIAILAAVGEEIVFRGLLQSMLYKLTKNVHVAVWSAAFLFSFMHLQFFGFFPRLILGAVLGYLFAWSGSLWTSILGHFINNFLGVIAYFMVNKNIIDENVTEEASWQIALFSLPFFIFFLFLYKRATETYRDGKRLDDDLFNRK